jgi:hypothetical protein
MKKTAILHAMKGEYVEAVALLKKMIQLQPDDTEPYIYIAGIYARKHNLGESLAWLKKAMAKGYRNWDELKTDHNFDSIRTAPSFKALVPAAALNDTP